MVFASLAILFYIFSFFLSIINPFLYFIFMIFGILIVASSIVLMIRSSLNKKDFRIISLLLKIGAFLGLLTFLLASV